MSVIGIHPAVWKTCVIQKMHTGAGEVRINRCLIMIIKEIKIFWVIDVAFFGGSYYAAEIIANSDSRHDIFSRKKTLAFFFGCTNFPIIIIQQEHSQYSSIEISCYNISMQKTSFIVDGLTLAATVFYSDQGRKKHPAVLFIHGWLSNQERMYQYAQAVTKLGYICMTFDMGGQGKSEGSVQMLTHRNFLEEAIAAYDYLSRVSEVDDTSISVCGSSFGSYLGAILTTKRKVKNLSLRVPADYDPLQINTIRNMLSEEEKAKWRTKEHVFSESLALNSVHTFQGKILIVESEKDDVVPHQMIVNYKNAVKNPSKLTYIIMKNATHSLQKQAFRDAYEKILTRWFEDRFKR